MTPEQAVLLNKAKDSLDAARLLVERGFSICLFGER